MQAIYKDEDEGDTTEGTSPMGIILYVREISRCVERKCIRRPGDRGIRIQINRGVSSRNKEGVWRRRGGIGKSSQTKKAGAREENNERICPRIQESSEGKWV